MNIYLGGHDTSHRFFQYFFISGCLSFSIEQSLVHIIYETLICEIGSQIARKKETANKRLEKGNKCVAGILFLEFIELEATYAIKENILIDFIDSV